VTDTHTDRHAKQLLPQINTRVHDFRRACAFTRCRHGVQHAMRCMTRDIGSVSSRILQTSKTCCWKP